MPVDQTVNNQSFPLSMADVGTQVKIIRHRGGQGLDKRLTSMGLHIDCKIEILQRMGSSLVVAGNQSRFALGAGMAGKIMVIPT